jgi:cytoskeletal protein RodZ
LEEALASAVEEAPSPVVEPHPIRTSDGRFAELGAQLRTRREALNLTREEIERHIHVRAHYLHALEEGDFSGLPSAVQTRGMLNNYATFLDLDVDASLLEFADVLQARHRERHPLPPGARGRPSPGAPSNLPPLRGFLAADMLGILLVLALIAFSVWGVQRVFEMNEAANAEPTVPSISEILETPVAAAVTGTATFALVDLDNLTATLSPLEPPVGLPTIPEGVTVQLNIIALERTFLRVIVDGEVVFEGRVTPGTAYPFDAATEIEVLAGNGAALRIAYNQRDLGLLGGYGEVVIRIYRAEGVITPTPTVGPTPTITLTPTNTATPTTTPVPTSAP